MNKIEKIRDRINNKEKTQKLKKNKKNKILSFTNFLLGLTLIGMVCLTYCKVDEEATLINGIFETNYSFKEMNNEIENYFDHLFNRQEDVNEKTVSLENEYISLGNNNYSTSDKVVNMLNNGTVISINFQTDYKYFIVINYDNGVVAMYTLIDETTLTINQKLNKNDVIGTYLDEYFNCVFKKGDEIIDYQRAL